MTSHRLRPPPLLRRLFTSPQALTSWLIALEFVVMTIVMPGLVYVATGDILAMIGFAAVGLCGAILNVRMAVRRIQERKALDRDRAALLRYENAIQAEARLAVPVRASWTAHCGCTHVHAYVDGEWLREQLSELNPQCPLVSGYGTLGGHGV